MINSMKTKSVLLLSLYLLFCGIRPCFSQISDPVQNDPLPVYAQKYNKSLLGKNVFVFDPGMDMKEVQALIDTVFKIQSGRSSEFSKFRFALLFEPGKYNLDVKVGYYMQILGLGKSPEDVIIEGAVRSNSRGNSVLVNFWRAVENLTVIPMTADSTMTWGVSQAAPMRRVYIKGNLNLFDKGYASGGFLADSKIDGTVASGPQQQWFTRNSQWRKWTGGNWNMMFVGVPEAPAENWPVKPYTTIRETPIIREKPFLTIEGKIYMVRLPQLKMNSSGTSWVNHVFNEKTLRLNDFYIANSATDNSKTINAALKKGKDLLFTPGIYSLDKSLKITRKGTVVIGIGMPSLVPTTGNSTIEVSDVDGVTVSGIVIDAGAIRSDVLFQVGEPNSTKSHAANPTFIFDVFVRVGGPALGMATASLVINSKDVCVDHIWLWRADHGNGVAWDKNRGANGLVVNSDNVTAYGLFVEHYQEYQTLWNGNNGRVYFYQSEMPYDPPAPDEWKHDGIFGYASYKVSDKVTSHEAWGLGIYNYFNRAPIIVDNAAETPVALESNLHHLLIFWLNGNKESVVKSIINGKGAAVNSGNRKATLN